MENLQTLQSGAVVIVGLMLILVVAAIWGRRKPDSIVRWLVLPSVVVLITMTMIALLGVVYGCYGMIRYFWREFVRVMRAYQASSLAMLGIFALIMNFNLAYISKSIEVKRLATGREIVLVLIKLGCNLGNMAMPFVCGVLTMVITQQDIVGVGAVVIDMFLVYLCCGGKVLGDDEDITDDEDGCIGPCKMREAEPEDKKGDSKLKLSEKQRLKDDYDALIEELKNDPDANADILKDLKA